MDIRAVTEADFDRWLQLRHLLYADESREDLLGEIKAIYYNKTVVGELDYAVFVADVGEIAGFIEVSLRESAYNSKTSPVGYIESLFVDPYYRGSGTGMKLVQEGEAWVTGKKCTEFYVDTEARYKGAQRLYARAGFTKISESTDEIVFRKEIK